MKPIDSTYEILYFKIHQNLIDERSVIWAIDMLETGFDSEHLRMLAGADKPYSYFYLAPLLEKALIELNIEIPGSRKIINNYTRYIIDKAIVGNENSFKVLRFLKELCVSNDYEKELMDFYLLYFAKSDLMVDTVQWYWPDADRNNIDNIIMEYLKNWRSKFEEISQQ